jgi:phosphoribosylformylglycinamidine cyclo-ligase
LVSGTDGVGTKLKLAVALDHHEGVGHDIVNHCVNDIFTSGASPIFFLDYIASGKLDLGQIQGVIKGLSEACLDVGCALIGGETAEMPGIYSGKDYDLVGFVVGVVEKRDVITGETISIGDAILGIPSSGLHTNGYSLARKILGETAEKLNEFSQDLGKTVGEALLEPHRCYHNLLKPHLSLIKGIAHITGGGLPGNIPRVLPQGTCARIDTTTWKIPPLFEIIRRRGSVDWQEMYRVFNMGIGMAIFCDAEKVSVLQKMVPEAILVGEVTKTENGKQVILD